MLLQQTESNVAGKDCVTCISSFFICRDEFEVYHIKYKLKKQLQQFYEHNIEINDMSIISFCCKTIQQSKCEYWYAARRLRILASTNVHNIKVLKTKIIENLVSSIL